LIIHWGLGICTRGGLDIGTGLGIRTGLGMRTREGLGIRIVLTVVRIPRLSRYPYKRGSLYPYGTDKICTLSES